MFKEIGAVMLFIGTISMLSCFSTERYDLFLIQLLLAPILINFGWQLIN